MLRGRRSTLRCVPHTGVISRKEDHIMEKPQCLIRYQEAINLLEESDVLLLRGSSLISWLIMTLGVGGYSHAGLVSIAYNDAGERMGPEVLEFREFALSRSVSLQNYILRYPGRIDIFRPLRQVETLEFDCKAREVKRKTKLFVGHLLTNEFRSLTGLNYSYLTVLNLFRYHLPFFRLFLSHRLFDDGLEPDVRSFADCSNSIAYLFQKHFTDLVKEKANWAVEPIDLSRSPVLNYLFTLLP